MPHYSTRTRAYVFLASPPLGVCFFLACFPQDDGEPDYTDVSKTENTRVSYPIYHIDNYEPTGMGGHPNSIVFLTCDAFGVLPPVSRLSPGQVMRLWERYGEHG